MRATTRDGIPALVALAAAVVVSLSLLTGCTPLSDEASEPTSSKQPDPPARSTPVPAPDGGTIDDVIDPAPEPETVKADLDDVAEIDGDVKISASKVAEIDVKAQTPGEIAGPALAVTVKIQNDSKADLDVETVMVTLIDSAGAVGIPTTAEPAQPFTGTIPPGSDAEGVYVFLVPEGTRDPIELTIAYSAGVPVVLLVGDASN